MITVSVPGKIHLMGEHAVVYGKPALLAAVNKRLTVSIEKKDAGIEIVSDEPTEYVHKILELVAKEHHLDTLPGMRIRIISAFPAGYHLGSSAAVAVALVGAATYFLKKIWNPIAINQLAFEAEKIAHGNPSGADNTAVTFGGFVWYRKELPFLKSIWQLPLKIPQALNHFYLINTGKPEETTKEMVEFVGAQVRHAPTDMAQIMDRNEQETRNIARAVKDQDEQGFITAMREGEKTLETMGVVSDKVIPCLRAIEQSGGAAKILGGGGKKGAVGYLLAYHADKNTLANAVMGFGYAAESITLGEEGIRLEEKE